MTGNLSDPVVSVVVPTRDRPTLVERAIRSVLLQTFKALEVVVVIDGGDPSNFSILESIGDPRVQVVYLDRSVGGSEARNTGVRRAKGSWIAFLDDDDEWLPEKISRQITAAEKSEGEYVFVASRYIERSQRGDRILPARSLSYSEPFSEFLFCRGSLRAGTGYVQTSTWFVSKRLVEEVPFTKGLQRNQDVDWMIHAMAKPGCQLHILEEALTIFYDHTDAGRVSKRPDWKFQYDWARANRAYLTPRAFSFCIATLCVPDAVQQQEPASILLKLLAACRNEGSMSALCFLFFFYHWFVSEDLRKRLRTRRTQRFPRESSFDVTSSPQADHQGSA